MKPKNILIWAESRFSASHLKWTIDLALELKSRGFNPILASSTLARAQNLLHDIETIPLPGWKTEHGKDKYKTINDVYALDDLAWQESRKAILIDAYRRYQPVAFLTETWPYAKGRIFDHELLSLLDASSEAMKCYALVMDIPFFTTPEIASASGGSFEAASALLAKKYSATFSTGDGLICDTAALLPTAPKIINPGYFFDQNTFTKTSEENIVVIGSGAGYREEDFEFYKQCLLSKPRSQYATSQWYVYISEDCPENHYTDILRISRSVPGLSIHVARNSPGFRDIVSRCRLLITRAGYFTVMPAAMVGIPMLIIPRPSSREQQKRAELLGAGGVRYIKQNDAFSDAVTLELAEGRPYALPLPIQTHGAQVAARYIADDYTEEHS